VKDDFDSKREKRDLRASQTIRYFDLIVKKILARDADLIVKMEVISSCFV